MKNERMQLILEIMRLGIEITETTSMQEVNESV